MKKLALLLSLVAILVALASANCHPMHPSPMQWCDPVASPPNTCAACPDGSHCPIGSTVCSSDPAGGCDGDAPPDPNGGFLLKKPGDAGARD